MSGYWRKCSEEAPPDDVDVLVPYRTGDTTRIMIGIWQEDEKLFRTGEEFRSMKGVTHWMPLPTPPEAP